MGRFHRDQGCVYEATTTCVEWKIDDFFKLDPDDGNNYYFESPEFSLAGCKWWLAMFPNICLGELWCVTLPDFPDPKTAFKVNIKRADGTLEEEGDSGTLILDFGNSEYCTFEFKSLRDLRRRKSELVPLDTLTITCRVVTPGPKQDAPAPFPKVDTQQAKQLVDDRMFQLLEKINKKVSELNTKVDYLTSKVDKITSSSTNLPISFDYLPEDVNLPITSLEGLDQLNDRLKKDKEFSAIMVRFLHNTGTGETELSFILSLTKKVLSQEIAVQFSRYGRKRKRSFINYNETLNVILAAASMKFKEAEWEDLADMFGKSLAGAPDWKK